MARRQFSTLISALDTAPERRAPLEVPNPVQGTNNLDRLGRTLAASPSRRGAVRLAARTTLALLASWHFTGEAEAHNALKKCQKMKHRAARRRCIKQANAHNAVHRKRRTEPRKPNSSCMVQWTDLINDTVAPWIAQTFTEPNGGKLKSARLRLARGTEAAGTFHLALNTVDAATGIPHKNTIASSVPVQVTTVGTSTSMISFDFPFPPTLSANRQYALVLSREKHPSDTDGHLVAYRSPGSCEGGSVFYSTSLAGEFMEFFRSADLIFDTTVTL